MTRRERLQFLLAWLALGVLPLFLRPLWEPDEVRYAQIPLEMLAKGDWMTPTLNGVLYFEKPPFQYWLTAVSLKLFGTGAAAARLPLALASLLSMAAAFLLARRLGARRPVWAAFMAASALLGFFCAQALTLDALFSALIVASLACAVEAVTARVQGRAHLLWTLGAFLVLALALLTKGLAAPVLLGGILLASLVFAWADPKLRRAVLWTGFHPLGWLLFLGISAPWFVAMEQAHPGHARFFFIHEHFARFSSITHDRRASRNPVLDKLFFLGVLAVGLLPWLSQSVVGFVRGLAFVLRRRGPQGPEAALARWTVATVVLGVLVPLGFFSLSGSKLAPYILPALVPMVALASRLNPALGIVYGMLLLFGMFSNALASLVAFMEYMNSNIRVLNTHRKSTMAVLMVLVWAASLAGFGNLVGTVFPVFGYIGIGIIVCICIHYAQCLRRKKAVKVKDITETDRPQ